MWRRRGEAGFSLIELALVLLVIGVLLAAMLDPVQLQQKAKRNTQTRQALEQAQQALLGFALIERRLPCAADPALADGAAGAGEEDPSRDASGRCVRLQGVLPWATLGVAGSDAWGRRLHYRVSAPFTEQALDASCGTASTRPCFGLTTPGEFSVSQATAGGGNLANHALLLVWSGGENGAGAWLNNGSQQAAPQAAHEQENSDGDLIYVGGAATETFDDVLLWQAPPGLLATLVQAGVLP